MKTNRYNPYTEIRRAICRLTTMLVVSAATAHVASAQDRIHNSKQKNVWNLVQVQWEPMEDLQAAPVVTREDILKAIRNCLRDGLKPNPTPTNGDSATRRFFKCVAKGVGTTVVNNGVMNVLGEQIICATFSYQENTGTPRGNGNSSICDDWPTMGPCDVANPTVLVAQDCCAVKYYWCLMTTPANEWGDCYVDHFQCVQEADL